MNKSLSAADIVPRRIRAVSRRPDGASVEIKTVEIIDSAVRVIDCANLRLRVGVLEEPQAGKALLDEITEGYEPVVLRSGLQIGTDQAEKKHSQATELTLRDVFPWFYHVSASDGQVAQARLRNVFVSTAGTFTFFKASPQTASVKQSAHEAIRSSTSISPPAQTDNCTTMKTEPESATQRHEDFRKVDNMTFLEFVLRSRVSAHMNHAATAEAAYADVLQVEAAALAEEVRSWMNHEEERADQRPCIWRHVLADLDGFRCGRQSLTPFLNSHEQLYLYGEPLLVNSAAKSTNGGASVASPDSSQGMYTLTNAPEGAQLHEKFHLSPNFLDTVNPDLLTTTLLWVSLQGQISHLHYDLTETFLAQVAGTKRVLLFPPSVSEELKAYPLDHPHDRQSQLRDLFDIEVEIPSSVLDSSKFDAYANRFKGFQCVIRPGDVLYLPCGWWHHVWSTPDESSVSATINDSKSEQPTLGQRYTSPIISLSRRWDPYKDAVRTAMIMLRQHGVPMLRERSDDSPGPDQDDVYVRLAELTETESKVWAEAGVHPRVVPVWRVRVAQSKLLAEKRNAVPAL